MYWCSSVYHIHTLSFFYYYLYVLCLRVPNYQNALGLRTPTSRLLTPRSIHSLPPTLLYWVRPTLSSSPLISLSLSAPCNPWLSLACNYSKLVSLFMHSVYFIELDGPLQCRFTYDSSSPFCPDAMSPDTIVPLLQDTPQPGSPEHDRTITAGNSPPPRLAEMVSPSCTYPVMDETILLTGRWEQSSQWLLLYSCSFGVCECTVARFSSSGHICQSN